MAKKQGAKKNLNVGERIQMIFDLYKKLAKRPLSQEEESILAGSIGFHMEDYKDQELLKEIKKINGWLEGQIT